MPRWLNPPNLLTALRLIATPFVLGALLADRRTEALAIFAGAACTDGLDGYLARRFDWATGVGAYLDPIADKVLLSGVFIGLAMVRETPLWFVGLVFGRDLLILLFAFFALSFTSVKKFPPTFWGKASTCLQALAGVVFLARAAMPLAPLHWAAAPLLWATAAATVWSGMHYGWRGYRMLRAH